MRFKNCIIGKELTYPIQIAESLLTPYSIMYKDLQKNAGIFKYNTPDNFLDLLLEKKEPISVFTYRPKNPWSKAIGYYSNGKIHLNIRKLPTMDKLDLVGFLLHEYAHYSGLNHGTGYTRNYITEDKLKYSVPYYLSENVKNWI
jgi:hypothetical protein